MLKFVKAVAKFFLRPKQFAQAQNYDTRLRFHSFFKFLDRKHAEQRKQLLEKLNPSQQLEPISEQMGFRKIEDFQDPVLAEAHKAARDFFKSLDLKKMLAESSNKHLVSVRMAPDGDPNSPYMKLALNPAIVKMVGDYLGMLPVIENILVWYSPNLENFGRSSQFYHFDAQDVRTLQMLLMVEDVDADSGPFVLLEATESEKLARSINYKKGGETKRIDDELVSQYCSADKIHKVVGPAGSLWIADSDRCFHYGSRMATKPRFMLVFQYFTPYAFSVPFKWWKGLPYAQIPNLKKYNDWQRLVLGAPQ